MRWFILQRLALLIPTLFGIVIIVFLMIHLIPGDPAQVMLGERASPESVAALRAEMGLDRPLYIQMGRYLKGLIRGDLGRSIKTHEEVWVELKRRFPATVELAMTSMLFAALVGISAGILSATRRGSLLDYTGMMVALVGISMPIFWLGLVVILLFSALLGIFPISGRISSSTLIEGWTGLYLIDSLLAGDGGAFRDALWHLCLPALALGTIPMAVIARMTRSSLLEVLGEDYIRTAWAKGLSEKRVILWHAMRNAMIPTVTIIALEFGYLLGGAIITETIFAWPGVGRWLLLAVQARDFRAIQGGVLLIATTFVIINLITDILYAYIDPRIRYQ
ncbi:MAG: ABC transporter permease [Candidatus Latescibacteria bacterium]|nr:ABC transporter permease [Candidatus Latescibacterota bacterium]